MQPRGFVLVWADATFFTEPREDAATFAVATFAGEARRQRLGETLPFAVRGSTGDFVELTPVPQTKPAPPIMPEADAHCGWFAFASDESLGGLSFFVRRRDLAPLLGEPLERNHADGTRLRLEAGTPVLRATTGYLAMAVGQAVPVDALTVAFAYPAIPADFHDAAPVAFALVRTEVPPRLGGAPFPLAPSLFAPLASAVSPRGQTTLFPLGGRCSALVVQAPTSAVRPYRAPDGEGLGALSMGMIGRGRSSAQDRKIPMGTVMRTAGGRPAATLSEDVLLLPGQAPCVQAGQRASSQFLSAPRLQRVESRWQLCADANAVRPHSWPGGRFGGTSTRLPKR